MPVTIKVALEQEVYTVSLNTLSFAAFMDSLRSQIPAGENHLIHWIDSEGDRIAVSSDLEFQEAIRQMSLSESDILFGCETIRPDCSDSCQPKVDPASEDGGKEKFGGFIAYVRAKVLGSSNGCPHDFECKCPTDGPRPYGHPPFGPPEGFGRPPFGPPEGFGHPPFGPPEGFGNPPLDHPPHRFHGPRFHGPSHRPPYEPYDGPWPFGSPPFDHPHHHHGGPRPLGSPHDGPRPFGHPFGPPDNFGPPPRSGPGPHGPVHHHPPHGGPRPFGPYFEPSENFGPHSFDHPPHFHDGPRPHTPPFSGHDRHHGHHDHHHGRHHGHHDHHHGHNQGRHHDVGRGHYHDPPTSFGGPHHYRPHGPSMDYEMFPSTPTVQAVAVVNCESIKA